MAELTAEKKNQCREVFDYFDRDKDGRLSKNDFSDAIKTLGIFIQKDELDSTLDKIPIYDYQNFEDICAKKLSDKINKDEIVFAFGLLDPNKTGKCSLERLKLAFKVLGEPFKQEELDNLLKEFTTGSVVDYQRLVVALVGQ